MDNGSGESLGSPPVTSISAPESHRISREGKDETTLIVIPSGILSKIIAKAEIEGTEAPKTAA
jgi:hypothetical protein